MKVYIFNMSSLIIKKFQDKDYGKLGEKNNPSDTGPSSYVGFSH